MTLLDYKLILGKYSEIQSMTFIHNITFFTSESRIKSYYGVLIVWESVMVKLFLCIQFCPEIVIIFPEKNYLISTL